MRAPFKPTTLTALLGATSVAAFALGLGDPAMESLVGQPLRARIPLLLRPGESVSPGCITVAPPKAGGGIEEYALRGARAELSPDGRSVVVATTDPLNAPVAAFSLHADCAGQALERDYTLLPDPGGAPVTAAAATGRIPAARTAPLAAAPSPPGTPWELRPGESVRAIAAAIYPGAPGLQQRLVSAIVRASPGAFPGGDADRPAPGAVIVIPDLRTLGAGAEAEPGRRAMVERGKATPRAAPRLTPAVPAPEVQAADGGMPLAEYLGLLQRIGQLEVLVTELRSRAAALPLPVAAPGPLPVAPAATPGAPAESGGGGPLVSAATAVLVLALGAAGFMALRKRRAPAVPTAAVATEAATAEPSPAPSGVDTALQEAQLSAARGYPERAFELLEQHIRAQPGETRTWMLFFAILRSQHMTTEYAELALRFAATKPAPALWQEVQRMGRELDPDSPLYRDESAQPREPAATVSNAPPPPAPGGIAG